MLRYPHWRRTRASTCGGMQPTSSLRSTSGGTYRWRRGRCWSTLRRGLAEVTLNHIRRHRITCMRNGERTSEWQRSKEAVMGAPVRCRAIVVGVVVALALTCVGVIAADEQAALVAALRTGTD